MKVAVVLGTSKSDGNTRKLVNEFVRCSEAVLFDLSERDISFYDYEHHNRFDDFLPLIAELSEFDHIVFASPVYWYSMSAQLKVFFDRLSDLLTIEKDLGRELKGKSISVLSTGYNIELPDCFIEPFSMTAKYMEMEFNGWTYAAIQAETDLASLGAVAGMALDKVH
ncbi:flavodoxin family protein [Vibrio atypicus]|jgi:multimeric flavodoxin WrbA|uniref:flavodoxin family protein n=1 Tax=Vibrio atypicus TaxID=558271 RepID=UPI00135971F5|nr:NAD(P)H-dependent oxidoreductase [Vibrio atypicus]